MVDSVETLILERFENDDIERLRLAIEDNMIQQQRREGRRRCADLLRSARQDDTCTLRNLCLFQATYSPPPTPSTFFASSTRRPRCKHSRWTWRLVSQGRLVRVGQHWAARSEGIEGRRMGLLKSSGETLLLEFAPGVDPPFLRSLIMKTTLSLLSLPC